MRPAPYPQLNLEFRPIVEPVPGPQLRAVFDAHWPAYHRWISRRAVGGPSPSDCRAQLRAHMPELWPIFTDLCAAFDADDHKARFLTLYAPTPLIRGCSQAICASATGAVLARNYDHAPHLCDGIVLASRWGGVGVHAMTDCLWGALDGVNEAGLAVALAFGGRKVVGHGFSASLIVRYLLQTCTTTAEARQALARLPVYMSYNFTVLDRSGDHVTAFSAPDRPTSFATVPVSTNHQLGVEWPAYAHFTQTMERQAHLASVVMHRPELPAVIDAFLRPPLFRHDYRKGSGTLYTVAYDPRTMDLSLFWQGVSAVLSPTSAHPKTIRITYAST